MMLSTRGRLTLIVIEIADAGGSAAETGVLATLAIAGGKSYTTGVFAVPPKALPILVGEHFLFENVIYEGTELHVSLHSAGIDATRLGGTTIPISRLEEKVAIQQYYSLEPHSRAAIKLELLFERDKVPRPPPNTRTRRDSGSSAAATAAAAAAAASASASAATLSAANNTAAGAFTHLESSYAVTQSLRQRMHSILPPTSDSPQPLSLPHPPPSGAASLHRPVQLFAASSESDGLQRDQASIFAALARVDLLSGVDVAARGAATSAAGRAPALASPAREEKEEEEEEEGEQEAGVLLGEDDGGGEGESLPCGLISYAVVFGPLSMERQACAQPGSSGTHPASPPTPRSSSPSPCPMSPASVTSSLRALHEPQVRMWDRFPAADSPHSPLPGKIEWFACPEGCVYVEAAERPAPRLSSFVLTAGGQSEELVGVCLHLYVATVDAGSGSGVGAREEGGADEGASPRSATSTPARAERTGFGAGGGAGASSGGSTDPRPWYETIVSRPPRADDLSRAPSNSSTFGTPGSAAAGPISQWVCVRLCFLSRWPLFAQLGQCLLRLYRRRLLPLLAPWEATLPYYYLLRGAGGGAECLPLGIESVLGLLQRGCPVPVAGVYSVLADFREGEEEGEGAGEAGAKKEGEKLGEKLGEKVGEEGAEGAAGVGEKGEADERVHFLLPAPTDLPMCPFSLARMASLLGPRGLVTVLGAALGEHKLLFHSHDLAALTPCCEALRALLYPIKWAHVYLPVVPAPLLDLVEAPVPFILGTHSAWLRHIPADCLRDVVLVDCDSGAVDTGAGAVLQLPPAEDRWLVRALKMILFDSEGRLDGLYGAGRPNPSPGASQTPSSGSGSSSGSRSGSSTSTSRSGSDSSSSRAAEEVERGAAIQAVVCDCLCSLLRAVPACLFFLHAGAPVFNRSLFIGTSCPPAPASGISAGPGSGSGISSVSSSGNGGSIGSSEAAARRRFLEGLADTNAFHSLADDVSTASHLAFFRDALARLAAWETARSTQAEAASPSSLVPIGEMYPLSPLPPGVPPLPSATVQTSPARLPSPGRRRGEGQRSSAFGLPPWVMLGRREGGGERGGPPERIVSARTLLRERLALFLPHIAWLADLRAAAAATAAASVAASDSAPASGAPVPPRPVVRVTIPLQHAGKKPPILRPPPRREGSPGLSVDVGGGDGGAMMILGGAAEGPPGGSSPGSPRRLRLDDGGIALVGMDKAAFAAYYAASVSQRARQRGLSLSLQASKSAIFGFLEDSLAGSAGLGAVEAGPLAGSLHAVHRFLQAAITGSDEASDTLALCIEALSLPATRALLLATLRGARCGPGGRGGAALGGAAGQGNGLGHGLGYGSGNGHVRDGGLGDGPVSSSGLHIYPLNASMFDALSRCFRAFLQVCVEQQDWGGAYDLLEVGGLYYHLPSGPGDATGESSLEGPALRRVEADDGSEERSEEVFLSSHLLPHPVYHSSQLWRSVLQSRVAAALAPAPGPAAASQSAQAAAREVRTLLPIMCALGINHFRALDFCQAAMLEHGIPADAHFELCRLVRTLWAEQDLELEQEQGDGGEMEEWPSPSTLGSGSGVDGGVGSVGSAGSVVSAGMQPPASLRTRALSSASAASDAAGPPDQVPGGLTAGGWMSERESFNASQGPGQGPGQGARPEKVENRYLQLSLDDGLLAESVTACVALGSARDGHVFASATASGRVVLASFRHRETGSVVHGSAALTHLVALPGPLAAESSSSSASGGQPCAFVSICSAGAVKLWQAESEVAHLRPINRASFKLPRAVSAAAAWLYGDHRVLVAAATSAAQGPGCMHLSLSLPAEARADLSWHHVSAPLPSPSSSGSGSTLGGGAGGRGGGRGGEAVSCLACSGAGFAHDDVVALGTSTGRLVVMDLDGRARYAAQAHAARVSAVLFLPSQPQVVATASHDRGATLWDLRVRGPVGVLEEDGDLGMGMGFESSAAGTGTSAAGTGAAAGMGGVGGLVSLQGAPLGPDSLHRASQGPVTALAAASLSASPCVGAAALGSGAGGVLTSRAGSSSAVLVSAGADNTLRLWDLRHSTSKPSAVLRGHRGRVTAVSFEGSGVDRLHSASLDGTVRCWEAASGLASDMTWVWGPCIGLQCSPFEADGGGPGGVGVVARGLGRGNVRAFVRR